MSTQIVGTHQPGFEAVHDLFAQNLDMGVERGAAIAVLIDGELVVDLAGGYADSALTKPWRRETLVNVFSATKGVAALLCALLVDRGQMAYDDKVVRYWPAFGAQGKGELTIGEVLSHQAGLCGLREPATVEDFYDQPGVAARLAAQAPFWPPGTAAGYHAATLGVLADEIVRRVAGVPMADFLRRELAERFALNISLGVAQERLDNVADIVAPGAGGPVKLPAGFEPSPIFMAAFANPPRSTELANTPAWRSAHMASVNGHANAISLARLYGALAAGGCIDGQRLLGPGTIEQMTRPLFEGMDMVLSVPVRWSAGFMLNLNGLYGLGPRSFGHPGRGGSIAFADPDAGLGFAYVTNWTAPDGAEDRRARALIDAIYRALEAPKWRR
jgi:CubicO group peptidase (beta-lactamase class C family)